MKFLFTLATILFCFFTIGTTAPQHARGKVLKHKKFMLPIFSFGLFVFGTQRVTLLEREEKHILILSLPLEVFLPTGSGWCIGYRIQLAALWYWVEGHVSLVTLLPSHMAHMVQKYAGNQSRLDSRYFHTAFNILVNFLLNCNKATATVLKLKSKLENLFKCDVATGT